MTGGTSVVTVGRGLRFRREVASATAFLGTAARLLWRHWPTLFALAFAGLAGRYLVQEAAVRASTVHPIVALLVLALGPLAILTSYIFMLRVLRESLPWAQAARSTPDDDRHNTLVDGFGSVLLPFVAVYTSQGFLQSDVDSFKVEVQRDAATTVVVNTLENKPIEAGTRAVERLILYPTWWVLGTFLVILLLRQVVLKGRGPKGRLWFGLIGAYIEMMFFALLVTGVKVWQDSGLDWGKHRQAWTWLSGSKDELIVALGSLGGPADTALSYILHMFASVEKVILVPLAWLTIGAVVYGHRLATPLTAEELYARLEGRWSRMPGALRWLISRVSATVRERLAPLVNGVRLIAHAGMRPMVLFCLVFVLVIPVRSDDRESFGGLGSWLLELERLVIGPQDLNLVWLPGHYLLGVFNNAIESVIVICLVAAAVDRVLLAQRLEPVLAAPDMSVQPKPGPPIPGAPPPGYPQAPGAYPPGSPPGSPPPGYPHPADWHPAAWQSVTWQPVTWHPAPPYAPPPPSHPWPDVRLPPSGTGVAGHGGNPHDPEDPS